ncbi:Gfo/Idh/MocA family protein [Candidatus Neomarinimicrobiota bacterium]
MILNRKLRMGMVGGGPGSFIGDVHRKALRLDGGIDIVAGAFSRDPEKSRETGNELFLDENRIYGSYQEMVKGEKQLPEGERIDFVSIVTTNDWHFAVAKAFLEAGFNVVCDKPMTMTVDDARQLVEIVKQSGKLFALTHNYTGYPMVKLARDIVRNRDLGKIRKIVVQYPQGWLYRAMETMGDKQASWRTNPEQCGASGCIGDIGTHAENLAEYITGLKISHICAELTTFVKDRKLEDDGNCLLKFESGARGILHASQIAMGDENNLAIWVYGDKKGLDWHQENPNYLYIREQDGPSIVWRRGNDYIGEKSPAAGRATRLPFGHPEAFFEAFANIYCNFADTLRAQLAGKKPDPLALDFPGVDDGLRGMLFIETVLESARSEQKWTPMKV